jgi:hypothetical protein
MLACFWLGLLATGLVLLARLWPAPPLMLVHAAAAVEWGFWHFGEFSRAYKECFGELPSGTLRRRDY